MFQLFSTIKAQITASLAKPDTKSENPPPSPYQALPSKDWVKAYVWISRDAKGQPVSATRAALNTRLGKGGNVGHVAAETPRAYMSHWPTGVPGNNAGGPFEKRSVPFPKRTLALDTEWEGDIEPQTTTFTTLDAAAVDSKYAEMTTPQARADWGIKGPKFSNSVQSCATFSYLLLRAGGIDRLSPKCACLGERIDKWMLKPIEPNEVRDCIDDAKKNETAALSSSASQFGMR